MVTLRCPQCSTQFQATPGSTAKCPNCGYTASVPGLATAPGGAPAYAPQAPGGAYPGGAAPVGGPIHGKPRSFGISLLLVIVTLGIYAYVWNYKVFRELDKEHGADHDAIWFWLLFVPFIGIIFFIIYQVKELGKMVRFSKGRGIEPSIGVGGFFLWYYLGMFIVVGPFVAYYKLTNSVNNIWRDAYQRKGIAYPG